MRANSRATRVTPSSCFRMRVKNTNFGAPFGKRVTCVRRQRVICARQQRVICARHKRVICDTRTPKARRLPPIPAPEASSGRCRVSQSMAAQTPRKDRDKTGTVPAGPLPGRGKGPHTVRLRQAHCLFDLKVFSCTRESSLQPLGESPLKSQHAPLAATLLLIPGALKQLESLNNT